MFVDVTTMKIYWYTHVKIYWYTHVTSKGGYNLQAWDFLVTNQEN